MPQVQLTDQIFKAAQLRAAASGYATVEEYVADVVVQDLGEETENIAHLFTPERIASLARISEEIKVGGTTYSLEEVKEHFESRRVAWLIHHRA